MGSLDPAKILVVLVIALIVLGPERLPRVARQAGAAWRELTRVRDEVVEEVRSALPDDGDLPSIPRIPSVRGTLSRYITETAPAPPVTANGDGASHEDASVAKEGYSVSPDDPTMN